MLSTYLLLATSHQERLLCHLPFADTYPDVEKIKNGQQLN